MEDINLVNNIFSVIFFGARDKRLSVCIYMLSACIELIYVTPLVPV